MFKNVGKELKELAESRVVIKTALSIPVALVMLIIGFAINKNERGDAGWVVCVALILGVLYVFGSYQKARLEAIRLYAFGQLVHKVEAIEKEVRGDVPVNVENKQDEQPPIPENIPQPEMKAPNYQQLQTTTEPWYCRHCDTQNPGSKVTCKKCGMHR